MAIVIDRYQQVRLQMIKQAGLVCAGIMFLFGCSGGRIPVPIADVSNDVTDVASDDASLFDTAKEEVTDQGPVADTTQQDTVSDAQEIVSKPCDSNEDCLNNACIETPDGNRCADTCVTDAGCPAGLTCMTTAVMGSDIVSLCVHPTPRICQPCKMDADCAYSFSTKVMTCAVVEGLHFCLPSCATGFCPKGYTCGASDGRPVCLPNQGQCTCTALGENVTGICDNSNDIGSCSGEFSCHDGAISACDARTPAVESCNNEDDDCDGKADNDVAQKECSIENAYGICPGKTLCIAGEELCQGNAAIQEMCNGLDDDCDGNTDEDGSIGCRDFYKDVDGDTYGLTNDSKCLCAAVPPYSATRGSDCDDKKATVNPGQIEICNNLDDSCDNRTDEGCDDDKDGYCDLAMEYDDNAAPLAVCPHGANDCDDTNGDRFPGNSVCGMDGDCDYLPKDVAEACDDQNWLDFDGCNVCEISETYVGTYTSSYEMYPSVAVFPNGRFVMAYIVTNEYTVNLGDVAARMFDENHVGDGSEFRVCTSSVDSPIRSPSIPKVAVLPFEGFVTTWWNSVLNTVLIRRFAAGGVPLDDAEVKVATLPSDRVITPSPAVASWSDGRFVIVYNGLDLGVQATVFSADGQSGPTIPISVSQTNVDAPQVSVIGDGFVVAWTSATGVFMRRFLANGTPVDVGDVQVNADTIGIKLVPMLSTFADNRIVVAWKSRSTDPSHAGIFARVYGTNGLPTTANDIALSTEPYPTYLVSSDSIARYDIFTVAMSTFSGTDGDGIALAWSGYSDGFVTYRIYASRYQLDGTRLASPVQISSHLWFDDFTINLATDPKGFIATWEGSSHPTLIQMDAVFQPLNPDMTPRYH